jgi:hypothetical protein
MVDVLGKTGLLEEVEELIRSMPVNPYAIIWGFLLSFYREYENIEMTKWAAKRVNELDLNESSSCVLLSNVSVARNHFEEELSKGSL